MSDKLAALATEIELRKKPPSDWATLLRWATTNELTNFPFAMADPEDPARGQWLEDVRKRCEWRFRLGLEPRMGCLARKANSECRCGEEALGRLSAAELATLEPREAKKRLSKLARSHHTAQRRWGLHKAKRPTTPVESPQATSEPVPAPPSLPSLTETHTRPLRPRWRREPAHPLSPWAFRHQGEITTRGIMEREF